MALLSLRGAAKSFGSRLILDGLDFDVEEGARLGVIGPNGGGKSTLLRILAGEEHADAGELTLRRGLVIAFLPQQPEGDERDAFRTPRLSAEQSGVYIKASAPFTSGNVHIGHVRSYSIGDAYARFQRARGNKVLFAFGFDAFGLPAELGAVDRGIPPSEWVARCAEHMTGQLQRLGFSFDWERTFMSSDPIMYRWSQWLFLELLGVRREDGQLRAV